MKKGNKKRPSNQKRFTADEHKIYGRQACLAVLNSRPRDIVRLYLLKNQLHWASQLVDYCVRNKKAYHVVEKEELEKICEAIHHEGICLLVKRASPISEASLLKNSKDGCWLALDGVQNPQNVGALLRICAHFGVSVVVGTKQALGQLSPSSYRTAEGGAEFVSYIPVADLSAFLVKALKNGYKLITTSSHTGQSVFKVRWPKKVVLVLGAEKTGVSATIMKLTDTTIQIPGTGRVESLNVASAAAICLGEWFSNRGQESK